MFPLSPDRSPLCFRLRWQKRASSHPVPPRPLRQGPGEAPPPMRNVGRGATCGGGRSRARGPVRQRRPRRPCAVVVGREAGPGMFPHTVRKYGTLEGRRRNVGAFQGPRPDFPAGTLPEGALGWGGRRRDGSSEGTGSGGCWRGCPRPDFPAWPRSTDHRGMARDDTSCARRAHGQPDAARVCPPPGWAAGAGGAQSPLRRQQPVERTLERADCPITSGL